MTRRSTGPPSEAQCSRGVAVCASQVVTSDRECDACVIDRLPESNVRASEGKTVPLGLPPDRHCCSQALHWMISAPVCIRCSSHLTS